MRKKKRVRDRERERERDRKKKRQTEIKDFSHTCNDIIVFAKIKQPDTYRKKERERERERYWILLVIIADQTLILGHPIPFL